MLESEFKYIRELVYRHSANVIEPGKEYLAELRLVPLLKAEGLIGLPDLVRRLRGTPFSTLHQKVVEEMTTNETSFFREPQNFEALRSWTIPKLIDARARERSLRIWCAASSTGQEPYSVAMLIREHFSHLRGWNVRILATDLSQRVLARAMEGRYSRAEVDRGVSPSILSKYFSKDGGDWRIRPEIQEMVNFSPINLAGPWTPMLPFDLVLLRNVLIYFDTRTKNDVLKKVRNYLRPDGYLFLGGSETAVHLDDVFEAADPGRSSCYRLRKAAELRSAALESEEGWAPIRLR